jgi:poly(hydroxyalkanoate) depolymerase family esterase
MNAFLKIDMRELTRLTRAGKLADAMRLLKGGNGAGPRLDDADYATAPKALDSLVGKAAQALRGLGGELLNRQAMPDFGDGLPPDRRASAVPWEPTRFLDRRFANPAGSRGYKVYVPSGYAGQKLPLVIMLHGCTQNPDDFAAGTRMNELAEQQSFLVAYPRQPQSANMQKCWNWFDAENQRRESGEPSIIAGITRQVIEEFNADPSRTYVAGLSAGGAAAAIMAATYPDLYAAIGVHSGLPWGAATDMGSAFAAMRGRGPKQQRAPGPGVPTIVFHGDADRTVNSINGDQVALQAAANLPLTQSTARGEAAGMAFTRSVQRDSRGHPLVEHWVLHGAGHAWSGGSSNGSFTEPRGPDASREMIRFFLSHRNESGAR